MDLSNRLLSAFYAGLNNNNAFARYQIFSYREGKVQGIFSRHDFQPKIDFGECNVWGLKDGHGSFETCLGRVFDGKTFSRNPFDWKGTTKIHTDPFSGQANLNCGSSISSDSFGKYAIVITDPPYVGDVNYSELGDFFMFGSDLH